MEAFGWVSDKQLNPLRLALLFGHDRELDLRVLAPLHQPLDRLESVRLRQG